MTHDSYRELIQRELDGDLSGEEVVLLERHVATCADCLLEREQYRSMSSVFGKIGNVKPERSFVPQMVPELPQFVQKKRRFMPQVWRGLSVAAVVVLAIGYSTNWQYGIGGQMTPYSQQIASVQEQETATQPEQLKGVPEQEQAGEHTISATSSQPTLIAQETVQTTPQVKAVAVASGDVEKVESQTGVKVEGGGSTISQGTAGTSQQNQMVVAAVDATATDVKVDGNNVTVTLVPMEKKSSGSEVLVFGIAAASSGSQTVTFTDPNGNVISTAQVDLPPSDEIIGKGPRMSHVLNEVTQESLKSDKELEWATDSYQVVARYLTDLGFAANAQVSATNEAEVVHVVQGGMHYAVGLEQPFVQGRKGIWRPTSISRMINIEQPQAFEKPIVAYFDGLKAAGAITAFENLYVTDPLKGDTVTVNVSLTKPNATVDQAYQFTLKQDSDGAWTLDGQPNLR